MSQITSPILLDSTFAAKLDVTNSLLASMVMGHVQKEKSLTEIRSIVAQGLAPKVFTIGDQINVDWSDGTNSYVVPLDVVHFGNVELQGGDTVPGMWLQWHYATPFGIPFDANEAFYVCAEALPVGTYYITAADSLGTRIIAGESYQFTTTVEVPAGGHLVLTTGTVDTDFENWRVYTYASGATTTPLETLTPVKGTDGTKLGDWSSSTKYGADGLNSMLRSNYGYNRWSQSALRQWLNSSAAAGAWWTSQNTFDRIPTECAAQRGFMAGFSDEFKSVIRPVKVVTALNSVSDNEIGTLETTYDTWFPAAMEQEYLVPQLAGEGEYWEYWKRAVGAAAPQAGGRIYPLRIRYAINAKTSPQTCRLRSADCGSAYNVWNVTTMGYVYSGHLATTAYRCAPACVIC